MNLSQFRRGWQIINVLRQHGIFHLLLDLWPSQSWYARLARRFAPHDSTANRQHDAAQLRAALESLGPIFIKVGQVMSTRPDLLPPEYIKELSHLQANITPLDSHVIRAAIESQLGKPVDELFSEFDDTPVGAASLAQVHRAVVRSGTWAGRQVAIKALRPGIDELIKTDIGGLYTIAKWLMKHHRDGERLRPIEVVAEIEQHLTQELDLQCEASNTSVLNYNFKGNDILAVPEVNWDLSARRVMTQQWMYGTPVTHIDTLQARGVDLKRLARDGVEIFFTQVFRDGFFHADMHPGNILVGTPESGIANGHYIALDCGIVGSISENDRYYLAINFLAFFNRDYRAVAEAHVRSGWVPPNTPIEPLTTAVRTSCEPYFGRPLSEISLGDALVRLFDVSRQFNVAVQPQLVLLQKTLLNIEGLGRVLDPNLDLWETAKPFLEKWMKDTLGPRGIVKQLKREWPYIAQNLATAPRLVLQQFTEATDKSQLQQQLVDTEKQYQQLRQNHNHYRHALGVALLACAGSIAYIAYLHHWF